MELDAANATVADLEASTIMVRDQTFDKVIFARVKVVNEPLAKY